MSGTAIVTMNDAELERVCRYEDELSKLPQVGVATKHVLHGGMYSRTIFMPKHLAVSGALISKASILVISGHVDMLISDQSVEYKGYHVIPASAKRKQIVYAYEDSYITATIVTDAKTLEEAEDDFTCESKLLRSRQECSVNDVVITGE
jgi:hypothetical protein